jgi:hypothetical protein
MATFTLRLDKIIVRFQRDKDHDEAGILFQVVVNNALSTVLRGFVPSVHSGDTIDLTTVDAFVVDHNNQNASIPSQNKWAITLPQDLPDVRTVNMGISVINTKSSHADSAQTFVSIATAVESASFAFIGGAGGALVAVALQAAGEELKKLIGDADPECSGFVYNQSQSNSVGELDALTANAPSIIAGGGFRKVVQITLQGVPQPAPDQCGHTLPQADAFVTIIRDELPAFPADRPPPKFRLVPVAGQDIHSWQGLWGDGPFDTKSRVSCRITVNEATTAVLPNGIPLTIPASLNVFTNEHFGDPSSNLNLLQPHNAESLNLEKRAATDFLLNQIADPIGTLRPEVPFAIPSPTGLVASAGTADSVAVDQTVSLALYGKFAAENNTLVAFAIRYSRRDANGNLVTDMMLTSTERSPT